MSSPTPQPNTGPSTTIALTAAASAAETGPEHHADPINRQETNDHNGGEEGGTLSSSYDYEYEYDEEGTDSREADDGSDDFIDEADDSQAAAAANVAASGKVPEEEEQESLLNFAEFSLGSELDGHRIMTVEAFQRHVLIGTNQGTVAVLSGPRAGGSGSRASTHTVASSSLPSSSAQPQAPRRPQVLQRLQNHEDPISDISCNLRESFVAACDKAGCVSVQSLIHQKDVWRRQMEVPLQSVALKPNYGEDEDCPLVCAGHDKVFLVAKLIFLSHRRSTVIAEGKGRVARVRWSPQGLIAWVTERGLTIYNYDQKVVLRALPSPVAAVLPPNPGGVPSAARRLELYPPTLLWEPPTPSAAEKTTATRGNHNINRSSTYSRSESLLCGWGDWVQQVRIHDVHTGVSNRAAGSGAPPSASSSAATAISSSSPPRSFRVESTTPHALLPSTLCSPYRVCGLAPFGTDRFIVLACIVDEGYHNSSGEGSRSSGSTASGEGIMRDLEVRVVQRGTLEDLYRGRVMLSYAHPLQLRLACCYGVRSVTEDAAAAAAAVGRLPAAGAPPRAAIYPPPDTTYYLVCGDTVVEATPCDEDDHVDYLLRARHYEEAYAYALRHRLRRHTTAQVAQQMLTAMLAAGDVDGVVELLPTCMGPASESAAAAWERWVFLLDQRGQSWKLINALPTRAGPQRCGGGGEGAGGSHCGSGTSGVLEQLREQTRPQPAQGTIMPTASHIGREYYDLVLLRALEHDAESFNTAVHRFEGLFSVDVVAKAAEMKFHACSGLVLAVRGEPAVHGNVPGDSHSPHVDQGDSGSNTGERAARSLRALTEAYGWLLRILGRNEEALQVLLKLHDSDELFQFIRRTGIFAKALELLPELFACGASRTVELLLEHAPRPSTGGRGMDASPPLQPLSSGTATAGSDGSSCIGDPLAPEAVVRRLQQVDRGCLWTYLTALRAHNKHAFTAVAKRHAQLVATLFVEYDRAQLLPFLRETSMYLDRVQDVYALCRKHGLLEEVVFLMARMGKEEDGLRVIVQQMKSMPKAIAYIAEVPTREDQGELFRRLVQLAVEANAQLPVRSLDATASVTSENGNVDTGASSEHQQQQRYTLHDTEIGDTYASIAARYGVPENAIREANTQRGSHTHITNTSSLGGGSLGPDTPLSRNCSQSFSAPSAATRSGRRGTGPVLRHYASGASIGGSSTGRNGSSGSFRLDGDGAAAVAGADAGVWSDVRQRRNSQQLYAASPPYAPANPPHPCIVPLNLLSALLLAAAEPAYADNPAIDATYLVRALPASESIPSAGAYIATVTRSRAEEEAFMQTVLEAAERDLAGDLTTLLRRRAAAIRIDPGSRNKGVATGIASPPGEKMDPASRSTRLGGGAGAEGITCGRCGQRVPAPRPPPQRMSQPPTSPLSPSSTANENDNDTGGLVTFACLHVYHPHCVRAYLTSDGVLSAASGDAPIGELLTHPEMYAHRPTTAASSRSLVARATGMARRRGGPYCRVCAVAGEGGGGWDSAAML